MRFTFSFALYSLSPLTLHSLDIRCPLTNQPRGTLRPPDPVSDRTPPHQTETASWLLTAKVAFATISLHPHRQRSNPQRKVPERQPDQYRKRTALYPDRWSHPNPSNSDRSYSMVLTRLSAPSLLAGHQVVSAKRLRLINPAQSDQQNTDDNKRNALFSGCGKPKRQFDDQRHNQRIGQGADAGCLLQRNPEQQHADAYQQGGQTQVYTPPDPLPEPTQSMDHSGTGRHQRCFPQTKYTEPDTQVKSVLSPGRRFNGCENSRNHWNLSLRNFIVSDPWHCSG